MTRPDFFIVGAPKCGTTALATYLGRHPDVFLPAYKEIHQFGSDLEHPTPRRSMEWYLSLFEGAGDVKRVGEASVWYLYSTRAAREIHEFNPSADIIIMLRNPVDMLYSLHSQALYNGTEDIEDFVEALAAETDRREGRRVPKNPKYRAMFYSEAAKFSEQVPRYFDAFGREKCRVIIFDDFKADTPGEFRRTLEFLGVAPSFTTDFAVVNPNKRVRSRAMKAFWNRLGRSRVKDVIPAAVRRPIGRALLRANTRWTPRPPMGPETRRKLCEQYAPEVRRLSELLGRDLTHWTEAQ